MQKNRDMHGGQSFEVLLLYEIFKVMFLCLHLSPTRMFKYILQ